MLKILLLLFILLSHNLFSQSKGEKPSNLTICSYHQDSLKKHYNYYRIEDSLVIEMQNKFTADNQTRIQNLQDYIMKNEALSQSGQLSEYQITEIQKEAQKREQELILFQETEGQKIEQETIDRLEKIYNQIEKLSKEFCIKEKIDILIAYQIQGQITYLSPKLDVTKEFIKYLNKHTKLD